MKRTIAAVLTVVFALALASPAFAKHKRHHAKHHRHHNSQVKQ
jgi:hypothetical protein